LRQSGGAIRAKEREIAANPRARSATLRVAERTSHPIPAEFSAEQAGGATDAAPEPRAARAACRLRRFARHLAPPGAQALRRSRAAPGRGAQLRDRVRSAAARAIDVGDARAGGNDLALLPRNAAGT